MGKTQKRGGSLWPEWGVTLLRNEGSLCAGIYTYQMKFIKHIFLFILLINSLLGLSQKIFITKDRNEADRIVFISTDKYNVNLWVYITTDKYEVKKDINSGIWYFTNEKYESDYKVYLTKNQYEANLLIFYTNSKFSAGIRN